MIAYWCDGCGKNLDRDTRKIVNIYVNPSPFYVNGITDNALTRAFYNPGRNADLCADCLDGITKILDGARKQTLAGALLPSSAIL